MVPKILSRLAFVSVFAVAALPLSVHAEDEKEKHGAYRYRQHDFDDRHDRFHDRYQDRHGRWHQRNRPSHPLYYRHDNRPYRHYDSYNYYQPHVNSYYQQRNDGCSFIYDFYGRIVLVCN